MTTLLFRALQISNVLSFLLATSVNIWGLTRSPNNIVDIFDQNPTYFTPVKIFVLIFWVIWFLSFVTFVFYAQWIEEVIIMEVVGKGVGLLFVMSNVFLCGWVWFWIKQNFAVSEIFVLLNTMCLFIIHRRLVDLYPLYSLSDPIAEPIVLFIHTPFSMYYAFSVFDLLYNGFVAFTDMDARYTIWALAAVWLYGTLGFLWIVGGFCGGKRDGIFGFTVACVLFAVAIEQQRVAYLAIQASVISLVLVFSIGVVWGHYGGRLVSIRRSQPETDPLLSET